MIPATLRRRSAAAVIALAIAVVGDGWAQVPPGPGPRSGPGPGALAQARDPARTRGDYAGSSLSDAVRRVQRSTGGQILGAERVPFDGRDINRVKYMDGRGRVRYMDDDPNPQRPMPRAPRPVQTDEPPRNDNP